MTTPPREPSPSASRPAVSAVIVAFHRPDSLRTLTAMLSRSHLEIVVVAVECDAAVVAVARDFGARVVELRGNPGFAAAVNAGVGVASGSAIVFMNDDVSVSGKVVLDLAELALSSSSVAVPALRRPDGVLEPSIFALPTVWSLLVEWVLTPDEPVRALRWLPVEKWRQPVHTERVEAAAAAMVACSKELLVEVPMPEAYFLYWEEAEWFWKLRERGIRVLYTPSWSVTHSGGRGDIRAQKSVLMARNAVRCVRRTQGRLSAFGAWIVVLLWNGRLVLVALLRRGRQRGTCEVRSRSAGLRAALLAIREVL